MKVLVIDLELTCWKHKTDSESEIIQIGIVEVDTITKKITRTKELFVKPEKSELSEFCMELTGITKKQVYKQGFEYDKAISILEKKFGFKNKLVIGWGRDDLAFNEKPNQYLNLSLLYSIKKNTEKKFNLKEALENEDIVFEGREHNALVDALNTAKLFLKVF